MSVWHQRLGHVCISTIKKMEKKGMVYDLIITPDSGAHHVCSGCAFGKLHRLPFPTGRTRATEIGGLIHSDVCGPMSKASPGGALYFVTFKDDYSRYCVIHFIKPKSEVAELFQHFVVRVEAETGKKVKTLRSDNGGEYKSHDFQNWMKKMGIRHETSVPKTPQQNGVAERQILTIVDMARSMLHGANISTELLSVASNAAVYILNRIYSSTTLEEKTQYEMWYKKKPNLAHIRIFGSTVFAHVSKDERAKFDPTGRKCVLVGYCETQKAFRLWDPSARKVQISRDVLFDEIASSDGIIPEFRSSVSSVFPPVEEEAIEEINDPFVPFEESHDEESDRRTGSPDDRPAPVQPTQVSARPAPVQPTRVSVRANKGIPAVTWADESQTPTYAGLAAVDDEITEPLTHREAMDSPQVHEWVATMDEELASLKKNQAWELTEIPPSRNIIQNRWVFKLKRDSSGGVQRFKARLVAKGYTQRAGIDYKETYSPVVRYDSLRAVLAIAAALDLEIAQLDVKTAFLYGDLNEELYMSQPTGFIKKGEEKLLCRLKRSLYGLKQSSRSWNSKFNEFITMYGLKPSVADPCVYSLNSDGVIIIMAIWVDDGLVCSNHHSKLEEIVQFLSNQFEMTSGPAGCFVGIQIVRNR
jgi:2-hydroxychromene-2-carboxylate isomerase